MLKPLLAFTRIPGNAFSFWIRQTLHWSKGRPRLYQEAKADLFGYLKERRLEAEARAAELTDRFELSPLADLSTAALFRKNLYLLDTMEQVFADPSLKDSLGDTVKALDVGSQDWHYVFALDRWLRFHNRPEGRKVSLKGLELDAYGIYADFHSRKDYAEAYAAQTGNLEVTYAAGDFIAYPDRDLDFISIFYPFVTRYQLLLWGLPLRFFKPMNFLAKAAHMLRPGGCLLVYCHSQREHELFLGLGRQEACLELLREGPITSNLVDFYRDIQDRCFSVWRKR